MENANTTMGMQRVRWRVAMPRGSQGTGVGSRSAQFVERCCEMRPVGPAEELPARSGAPDPVQRSIRNLEIAWCIEMHRARHAMGDIQNATMSHDQDPFAVMALRECFERPANARREGGQRFASTRKRRRDLTRGEAA